MKEDVLAAHAANTDHIMINVWLTIFEDFSNLYGHKLYFEKRNTLLQEGIKGFREISWPSRNDAMPSYFHKWQLQLENLFKRYIAQQDAYTDDMLTKQAKEKFLANQVRIAVQPECTSLLHRVLRQARVICTKILGDYDENEHKMLCSFGKRACQGTPYRESYLDEKLFNRPFTGSYEHIGWFAQCVKDDPILKQFYDRALDEGRVVPVRSLQYSLVPKSFKALRGIMPNTLLGSFYTSGLGKLFELRLKKSGLNIKRLQRKHRRLVKRASILRNLVTADLSSASDSLALWLLRWILPKHWYDAVVFGRARYVEIDGKEHLLSSIVTMGLGQTFTLQTLIFYCLLKAIGELDGRKHYVSVYGDDLIYSTHLHKYVKVIFPKINLQLNMDKTYDEDFFRESCGCDYHRGVDVRPFQPEGRSQALIGLRRQSFLYRLYNGLKLRWDETELPSAFAYLLTEMSLNGVVHQVPLFYPDGSGVRVEKPKNGFCPVMPIKWEQEHCSTCSQKNKEHLVCKHTSGQYFLCLHEVSDKRFVSAKQLPYFWEKLRSLSAPTAFSDSAWIDAADTPVLSWIPTSRRPRYVRGQDGNPVRDRFGRKLRRKVPYVSKKGSTRVEECIASVPSWGWFCEPTTRR